MLLSKTAEYALRCMVKIASMPKGCSANKELLNQELEIPTEYLSKVLRKLTLAGILTSEKGHGGGYKLASDPKAITFLDVVGAVGFSFGTDHCIYGWSKCNSREPCPLHESFSKLSQSVHQWAMGTTLADIDKSSKVLSQWIRNTSKQKP